MAGDPSPLLRLRVTFQKSEALRYTGHLDLHRAWERMLRRAGLPLAYSLGFHPQPRIQQACALPLGFTSREELIDIWLEQAAPVSDLEASLRRAAPPGLEILHVECVDLRAPALQTQVRAADYEACLLDPLPETSLQPRIDELLAAEALPRERRGKTYDLRPLIHELVLLPREENQELTRLQMRLSAREGATGRPEEVLAALDLDPLHTRIERIKLLFVS